MQTQGQGHNLRSWDLFLNFEIFIKLHSNAPFSERLCRAHGRAKVTLQEVSEYDQEIPQPHTTDQHTATKGEIDKNYIGKLMSNNSLYGDQL